MARRLSGLATMSRDRQMYNLAILSRSKNAWSVIECMSNHTGLMVLRQMRVWDMMSLDMRIEFMSSVVQRTPLLAVMSTEYVKGLKKDNPVTWLIYGAILSELYAQDLASSNAKAE